MVDLYLAIPPDIDLCQTTTSSRARAPQAYRVTLPTLQICVRALETICLQKAGLASCSRTLAYPRVGGARLLVGVNSTWTDLTRWARPFTKKPVDN